MLHCHNSGLIDSASGKEFDSARKVVAAAPDFSWGWSAVAEGALGLSFDSADAASAADYRRQAMEAADRAISLDKSNSEALDIKALLQDPRDLVGREALFKQALSARPLACGCEHHLYGLFLQAVGRNSEAVNEFRRSTDVLALDYDSQLSLGDSLLAIGKRDEAKSHFDSAADLSPYPAADVLITVSETPVTMDYAASLKALQNPKLTMPASLKAALQSAFQAILSGDTAAKARAVQMLTALPPEMQGRNAASTLAALGAHREAMQVVAEHATHYWVAPASWMFVPSARALLDDPAFPAFAQKLGLMTYWKTTHTRPDVCSDKNPPPFCRMI
jgi:tetratricopeptide (TPR) repeat protein